MQPKDMIGGYVVLTWTLARSGESHTTARDYRRPGVVRYPPCWDIHGTPNCGVEKEAILIQSNVISLSGEDGTREHHGCHPINSGDGHVGYILAGINGRFSSTGCISEDEEKNKQID